MSTVTVALDSMWQSNPDRIGSLGLEINQIIRVKRQRKIKDKFLMIASIKTSPTEYTCQLIRPNFYKKKNGYTVDRLRKIYKHKQKKIYF